MVTWFHSAALCASVMGCHGGIEGSPAQLYLRKVDACRWQLFVSFIFFLQISKVYLRINLIYQTLTVYSVFIRNAPKLNATFFLHLFGGQWGYLKPDMSVSDQWAWLQNLFRLCDKTGQSRLGFLLPFQPAESLRVQADAAECGGAVPADTQAVSQGGTGVSVCERSPTTNASLTPAGAQYSSLFI